MATATTYSIPDVKAYNTYWPHNTSSTNITGWQCGKCGAWVFGNDWHTCGGQVYPSTPQPIIWPPTTFEDLELAQIIERLKKLKDLLDSRKDNN